MALERFVSASAPAQALSLASRHELSDGREDLARSAARTRPPYPDAPVRVRPGVLRPIEQEMLEEAVRLQAGAVAEFHGFAPAKELADRLRTAGLLASRWEDTQIAAAPPSALAGVVPDNPSW